VCATPAEAGMTGNGLWAGSGPNFPFVFKSEPLSWKNHITWHLGGIIMTFNFYALCKSKAFYTFDSFHFMTYNFESLQTWRVKSL
jgi:hypothetical protein